MCLRIAQHCRNGLNIYGSNNPNINQKLYLLWSHSAESIAPDPPCWVLRHIRRKITRKHTFQNAHVKKKKKKMTKLLQTTAGDDKVVKLTNSSWYSLIIGLTQSLRQFLKTTLEGISWFMRFMMENERHCIYTIFPCNIKSINSNLTSYDWHKQEKLRTVKHLVPVNEVSAPAVLSVISNDAEDKPG